MATKEHIAQHGFTGIHKIWNRAQGWKRGASLVTGTHREKKGKRERERDSHQRGKGMHLDAAGEETAGEEGWSPARGRLPETERGWPEGRGNEPGLGLGLRRIF
jgi:hypothetical protein